MSHWQLIETAPKDGSTMLLWSAKARYKPVVGKWVESWKSWQSQPGAWTVNPTHWMPLPEPPASGEHLEAIRVGGGM